MNFQGPLARRRTMPTPFAPRIILAQNARSDLQTLARAHSAPQWLALRAQIILRAAEADTPSNVQIGHDLGCSNRTVGKWRQRYHHLGFQGLQDAPRSGRPRTIVPATRVRVISVASDLPQAQDRPVTRWTLAEIVATLLDALNTDAISRSSIWRILQEVDLKPHKSAYWLNSHDEQFASKAQVICQLYAKALAYYQQNRLVICCDEKTGMQVLERKAPTKPAQPGRRERREHEYIRRGTRVLINSLAVATGQLAWTIGATRKATDFVAQLNQAELFFGVLHRRFLARGSFHSVAEFTVRLARFLQDYNTRHAHPYRWTYTGEPLVRDTPFSRTRRQQRRGRACFSPRPKRFERLLYAPRPYHRRAA